MSFLINPYAFLAAGGDFESIATVTVGSGGASSIDFTSIPSTYQHLQIRFLGRSAQASATTVALLMQMGNGSVDTGSNYSRHQLYGSGASATASGQTSQSSANVGEIVRDSATASVFGVSVIDILDYASTSKNKTIRVLSGTDINNSSGYVALLSNAWLSTSAVDTIKLFFSGHNLVQHSTAALYGIKAP